MQGLFIWTKKLGGPHPPFVVALSFLWLYHILMSGKHFISHTMSEVMQKFQQAEIVDDNEDFLFITEEDLEASVEENHNSCYGKMLADRELYI